MLLALGIVLAGWTPALAGSDTDRIRDGGAKDGQGGDLAPWEGVDGITAASTPGPGGGDSDEVVREGCDCDTEQCTQAPGAAPLAGAAGLLSIRRRKKKRGRHRRS